MNIKNIILVFIGSALGGVLRYIISEFVKLKISHRFPLATFSINIIGCFLIGIVIATSTKTNQPETYRILLATGFCGGFTTFSAFASENINLIKSSSLSTSIIYISSSIVFGMIAVYLGSMIFSKS